MKNITISDVAEALGVSKTTVSRAISGKGRIGNKTRERVLAYIEEHNYTPNVIAQGLAQSKTYNIGVVIPAEYDIIDLPFFQRCLFGIQEIAAQANYDILLMITPPKDTSQLDRVLTNHKVDGVILMRTFVKDLHAEMLSSRGIPFVTIGGSNVKPAIQVDQDHRSACRELTAVLLGKNMRRLALVGGEEKFMVTRNRLSGYLDAFRQMDVLVSEDLICLGVTRWDILERKVEEILAKKAEGIICMDDALCSQVLKKLRLEKVSVPEDIKVASFYNSTVLENYTPSITSLSFDEQELGRAACQTLMEQIQGKECRELTVLSYRIVPGDSA